ncbi:FAD/NAD(P)-binding domain-containing protein [Xylaria acuta]|nr:FAD/NAD(P)-binding domain-containing protein [Xylaria acuta]
METPFRVVIIGAGPTGLALGNMLAAAHIDFVILERHDRVVTESGACIMLWPHSTRVLEQLGLLDTAIDESLGLHSKSTIDNLGRQQSEYPTFRWIGENHGYPTVHLPRTQLIKLLYDGLRDHRSKIKTSSFISAIDTDENGVCVTLSDGSVEKGSIVIGCDGVHSHVREYITSIAKADGIAFEASPQVTQFECLFGTASPIPGLKPGVFYESHGPGMVTQIGMSDKIAAFSLFRKLEETTAEEDLSYDDQSVTRFLKEYGERFIAPGFQVRDLQKYCTWTRLACQPEGCAGLWYHGRIVLCGESAVQMSSVMGMGFNAAIQSAVCLANSLHQATQTNSNPNMESITKIFRDYRELREAETVGTKDLSANYIRAMTSSSWVKMMVIRYVLPWVWGEKSMMKKVGTESISHGRKLGFIPYQDKHGIIPWWN